MFPSRSVFVIETSSVSVSGISSRTYFVVQLQVAFPQTFAGVGVFAGQAYHCAVTRFPKDELQPGSDPSVPICDGCPPNTTLTYDQCKRHPDWTANVAPLVEYVSSWESCWTMSAEQTFSLDKMSLSSWVPNSHLISLRVAPWLSCWYIMWIDYSPHDSDLAATTNLYLSWHNAVWKAPKLSHHQQARKQSAAGNIDPLQDPNSKMVFLYRGTRDRTYNKGTVNATRNFFQQWGIPADNIHFTSNVESGHLVPGNKQQTNAIAILTSTYLDFRSSKQSPTTHCCIPLL